MSASRFSAPRLSVLAAVAALSLLASTPSRAGSDVVVAAANVPTISITAESLSATVRSAVRQAVGETSPDITVASSADGAIDLGGWARSGSDVGKATVAALNVDGVTRVHANGVHLWSSRYYQN